MSVSPSNPNWEPLGMASVDRDVFYKALIEAVGINDAAREYEHIAKYDLAFAIDPVNWVGNRKSLSLKVENDDKLKSFLHVQSVSCLPGQSNFDNYVTKLAAFMDKSMHRTTIANAWKARMISQRNYHAAAVALSRCEAAALKIGGIEQPLTRSKDVYKVGKKLQALNETLICTYERGRVVERITGDKGAISRDASPIRTKK